MEVFIVECSYATPDGRTISMIDSTWTRDADAVRRHDELKADCSGVKLWRCRTDAIRAAETFVPPKRHDVPTWSAEEAEKTRRLLRDVFGDRVVPADFDARFPDATHRTVRAAVNALAENADVAMEMAPHLPSNVRPLVIERATARAREHMDRIRAAAVHVELTDVVLATERERSALESLEEDLAAFSSRSADPFWDAKTTSWVRRVRANALLCRAALTDACLERIAACANDVSPVATAETPPSEYDAFMQGSDARMISLQTKK